MFTGSVRLKISSCGVPVALGLVLDNILCIIQGILQDNEGCQTENAVVATDVIMQPASGQWTASG